VEAAQVGQLSAGVAVDSDSFESLSLSFTKQQKNGRRKKDMSDFRNG